MTVRPHTDTAKERALLDSGLAHIRDEQPDEGQRLVTDAFDALAARLDAAEADRQQLRAALRAVVMAEPDDSVVPTPWPSFAGQLQSIAAAALLAASAETEKEPT